MTAMGSRRRCSIRDVACAAEVSTGTVSNVLNRPERVSPGVRDRVQAAMAELGFVPNESARHLRSGTSRTLAYVMLDASNPFFTDVARGIERAIEADSLSLVLCNSGNDSRREGAHLIRLQQQRVQGVLVTPVDAETAGLEQLRRSVPVVIIDRSRGRSGSRGGGGGELCTVAADDVLGGRLAVEHLVDLGHRRIAVVGGPRYLGQVRDRWEGARQAWAAAHLPSDDLLAVDTVALDVQQGRDAAENLLALPAERRPTAVFCINDLLALGLLQHAIGSGLRVPEELAIIGYDDIEFAAAAAVPLTSVRQPREDFGHAAADLVRDEATNPDHRHRQVVFTPELIARTSTAYDLTRSEASAHGDPGRGVTGIAG